MAQAFRFVDLLAQVGEQDDNDKSLPPDTYTVRVEEAEAVIAGSGNPMIKVKFVVLGGPQDNKWIFNQFVLAINSAKGPDALKPFFRQMKAFDLDAEFFNSLGDQGLEAVAPLLVGKVVDVKTAVRKYQGVKYTDVKGVSKSSGGTGGIPIPGVPVPQTSTPVPQVPQVPSPASPVPVQVAPPVPGPPTGPPPPPF